MAEGKKRLYKRETVERIFDELRERVRVANDQNHIKILKNVIVFGSFINSDNPMIHDLDVYFETGDYLPKYKKQEIRLKESIKRLKERRPNSYNLYLQYLYYPEDEIYWFLKNKVGIISLHTGYDINAATYQKHIYLMKDGIYQYEPLICDGTGIRIEQTDPIEW